MRWCDEAVEISGIIIMHIVIVPCNILLIYSILQDLWVYLEAKVPGVAYYVFISFVVEMIGARR